MNKYDYLIVGAGLYGSMFAYKAQKVGKKVLVIDKRPHIGGNLYCEKIEGINVHKYGPHIFLPFRLLNVLPPESSQHPGKCSLLLWQTIPPQILHPPV